MNCKYCDSETVVKNGSVKGAQVFKCKNCGHRFTEGSAFPKMRTESRIISSSIDFYFEGLDVKADWHNLVKDATKDEALNGDRKKQVTIEVTVK